MKSHKEQNLLIDLNNSGNSLSALSIINIRRSMEHMKIKGLVDALFLQIGLKRNEKYKLEEIIKIVKREYTLPPEWKICKYCKYRSRVQYPLP